MLEEEEKLNDFSIPSMKYLFKHHTQRLGFPNGSDGKGSACCDGDTGLIPGWGRCPGEVNGNALQYSWPGELHGQRSLAGYSAWCRKKSDMTKQLNMQR